VAINFKTKDFVILGTEYAGEMKKGVFTIMNYLMPKSGLLSLHSSCNEGEDGSTSLFFGLSGLFRLPKMELINKELEKPL
jgi:phosphoenolpyruvate carboxykinase (ATP)